MSKKLFFTGIFLSSILGGLIVYILITNVGIDNGPRRNYVNISNRQELMNPSAEAEIIVPDGLNFLQATERVLPSVVHIQSTYSGTSSSPIDRMFGREAASTGSGVIITDDGYVATNYHVIEDAKSIDVTLSDNQVFEAEVVGVDRTTDLALLKIDARGLDFVRFGDSDEVRLGEWVLAIGNPFNLNSTVTAGIVSAKARNIDIIRGSNLRIESFIQTDAAVNPGNSGGALVNLKGNLIGINTAIATTSGRFEGYSFAVPVNLVEKVMNDLLEFGETKRGLLGISISDMDARLAEEYDLDVLQGVYIINVTDNGAGKEAGLLPGDVIIGIDNKTVSNVSELQEFVARNRPGDEITVIYIRDNEEFRVKAMLRDINGSTDVYAEISPSWNGVSFEDISFRNDGELVMGVKVLRVQYEKWAEAGIDRGFMITHLNEDEITSTQQLIDLLDIAGEKYTVKGVDQYGHSKVVQID